MNIIGGTVHKPNVKLNFIQGLEHELPSIQNPNIAKLVEKPKNVAVSVPTVTSILAVTNETEIDTLVNSARVTYNARPFIPITPFLCQDVSDSIVENDGNAKKSY